jgi:hypothetical protein
MVDDWPCMQVLAGGKECLALDLLASRGDTVAY